MPKQIWEQIYEKMLADIREKVPGEMLLSELQYSKLLEVSRATVRKAVDALAREGLVRRIAGKGLMVGDPGDAPARGNILISCACLPGDSDNFKSVLGCIGAAEVNRLSYKTYNYTNPEERYFELMQANLSEFDVAVITCYESEADRRTCDALDAAGLPVVVICNESVRYPFFDCDSYNTGFLCGEYLVRNNHDRILFIGTNRPIPPDRQKENGFRAALAEYGVPIDEELFIEVEDPGIPIYTGLSDQRTLPPHIVKYVDGSVHYTAVTGHSCYPILSFIKRLLIRNISIPEDLSVVSIGGDLYLPWLDMPLTGIDANKYEIGYRAVDAVARYLFGENKAIESAFIPVQLIQRKTVRMLEHGLPPGGRAIIAAGGMSE